MGHNYIQAAMEETIIVSRPRNFSVKIRLDSRRRAPDILNITMSHSCGGYFED